MLLCTLESICLEVVLIIVHKFIVYRVGINNINLSVVNMNKVLKRVYACYRIIKVTFLFVPCSTPVALEMEASDDYCASKS